MDTNNCRPNQDSEANMDTGDWRGALKQETRQRIVSKILDALKRHLPVSIQEGLHEIQKIAQRIEEKIFTASTSQTDYLRKISFKIFVIQNASQGTMPPNVGGPSNKPADPGFVILPQVHNPWQQHPVPQQQQQQSQHAQQYLYQQQILWQKLQQHRQQQLMSQIQSQPAQLQQQLGLQQQQNPLQRHMPQRLQALGPLLQQPSVLDQQMQLFQSQPHLPETSSSSLHSTVGQSSGGDWQEEVYQKIQFMKECYLPELNEIYQKISTKLEQYDSLPQQPNSDHLEKIKVFKMMLDRIIAFLQVSKSNISPNIREKLGSCEKQIINFVSANRPRNPLQSGQLPPPQVTPVQSCENQINFGFQTRNMQDSVAMLQQNMASMTLFDASIAQPSMMNSMQPSTSLDSDQEMLLTPCNRFQ